MPIPGERLTLSTEDRLALGQTLVSMLEDMESQYDEMFKSIEVQWSQYEAELAQEIKSFPWDHASNIIVPLIRIHSDATQARYQLLLRASDKVWVGKSLNDEFKEQKLDRSVVKWLNWAANNDFDFDEATEDWTLEIVTVGCGVLALGWQEKTKMVLFPGEKKAREVLLRSGPLLEHIPREDCLWDTNYRAWDAPIFARTRRLTWPDLIKLGNEGWDQEAIERIKGQTLPNSSAGGNQAREDKDLRGGSDTTQRPSAFGLYDTREVWVDWSLVNGVVDIKPPDELVEGEDLVTVVAQLHRNSGELLDLTAKPYAIDDKPFYDAYFKKRSGANSSSGTAKLLEHMQEAATTFMNQAADTVTRANTINPVTSDERIAGSRIQLNEFILTDDANIKDISPGKNIAPDVAIMQQVNVLAERLTGITDPALGRETRMGGHPAPATSTLSLLQEGKKLDTIGVRSIRRAISKIGADLITLYQQLEQDVGKIVRAVGAEDAELVKLWMNSSERIAGGLELNLAALSETMNPQLDQQKALGMFQITNNFYSLVLQYLQVAVNPQAPPPLVEATLKAVVALQESYEKVLETGDIDDTKKFLLDLEQLIGGIVGQRAEAQGPGQQQPGAGGAQGDDPRQQGINPQGIGSGL